MIPVLIVPTILQRKDLLERMFASIDHPVERIVLVDNSLSGYEVPFETPAAVEYIRPILGLGNHGGINAGIAQTPEAPWWLFVTDDIAFGPGDLDEIVAMIEDSDDPALITGSINVHDPRLLMFCYGALNRACVEKVGFIDEWTFYPIYFGDNDYRRRCRLAGVEWIEFDGDIRHGDDDTTSATLKANAHFQERNVVTFERNRRAYEEKWGGPIGGEQYATPWNLPVPLDWTRIDITARAERIW
jgi:GT2 family glycosyltransferase